MMNNKYKKGVKQHDLRDCGPACLATICRIYGLKIPLVSLREDMKIDKNGTSIYSLCRTSEKYGLDTSTLYGTWEELVTCFFSNNSAPFIAHVIVDERLFHFIVVLEIKNDKIIAFDPAKGRIKLEKSSFIKIWSGYIVTITKNSHFKKANLNKGSYKKFFEIVSTQKRRFVLAIFLSFIIATVSILTSLIYQQIIDKYVLNNTGNLGIEQIPLYSKFIYELEHLANDVHYLFVLIIIIYLIQFVLFITRGYIIARISRKSNEILMSKYFSHFLKLPIAFFNDRDTGEILSRFNNIDEVQDTLSGLSLVVIFESTMVLVGGIVLAKICMSLFFIVLIIAVIYIILIIIYKNPFIKINREIMENDAMLTSTLKESVDGIETLKSFCGEETMYKKLIQKTGKLIGSVFNGELIGISQSGLLALIESLGMILILWQGVVFVIDGRISLGTLIAFESLVYTFLGPVQSLVESQLDFQAAIIAMDRLNDVMSIKPEKKQENVDFISIRGRDIRAENVSFSYANRGNVLKNINVLIKYGEKVAVVGSSGSGKSTLLKLLATHYQPTSGDLSFGYAKSEDSLGMQMRKKIAYIPQNTILFSGTVKENIFFNDGHNVDKKYSDKVLSGCNIHNITQKMSFGINTIVSENGKDISGGQRQRIAFARAMMVKPELILLDESTSNLDVENENNILNFIHNTLKEVTCIHITHKPNLLDWYDRIICIEDGEIAWDINHKKVFKKNYYELTRLDIYFDN